MAYYRSGLRRSRFEKHARTVGIVVATILLGLTAVEMATMSRRNAAIQKQGVIPPAERQP